MKKLTARWKYEEESGQTNPTSVVWEDGRAATMDDYLTHQFDTHRLIINGSGEVEQHIYLEIVADVTFDPYVRSWAVSGRDVDPAALDLTDPNASDGEIIAALWALPTVYKAHIIRSKP